MTLSLTDIIVPALSAAFGSLGTVAAQAIDRRHRKNDKKDELAVEDAKLLHQTEVEFRKALLLRIRDLERHDTEKSGLIEKQARQIADLTAENGRLKAKVAELEART